MKTPSVVLKAADALIRLALQEDLGPQGDITTRFCVRRSSRLGGRIKAEASGVLCGTEIAAKAFKAFDPSSRVKILVSDGKPVRRHQTVLEARGGPKLLSGERTALNFLSHLSGIATLTASYVAAIRDAKARICDTRKTLPGWRLLQKYAVACGGGFNHRKGLYDAVLFKDNHWACGEISPLKSFRRRFSRVPIGIEVKTTPQLRQVLDLRPDFVLLDNMNPRRLKTAMRRIRTLSPQIKIEISGGVILKNVRTLAGLGADRISIGRLTHSAPSLDFSFDAELL